MNVTQIPPLYAMGGAAQMRMQMPGGPPPLPADMVARFDTDSSGGLSAKEVRDSALSNVITSDTWGDVDVDGDGSLSLSELDRHRGAMRGDGPPPPPPGGGAGGGDGGPAKASAESLLLSLFDEAENAWASILTGLTDAAGLYATAREAIGSSR